MSGKAVPAHAVVVWSINILRSRRKPVTGARRAITRWALRTKAVNAIPRLARWTVMVLGLNGTDSAPKLAGVGLTHIFTILMLLLPMEVLTARMRMPRNIIGRATLNNAP